MKLKDAIFIYRVENNLNQTEFGKLCGLSQATITALETGKDVGKFARTKALLFLSGKYDIEDGAVDGIVDNSD